MYTCRVQMPIKIDASRKMQFITEAIRKEIEPTKTGTDTLILRDGHKYRVLVGVDGKVTKAGKLYENRTGRQLPTEGYDVEQTPVRTGNVETIRLRGGKEKVVRRYDPATNDYKYTALGKRFYGRRQIQYVVKVPAIFSGTRSNGQPYERRGFFPITDPVSLSQNLTIAQRDAKIKHDVTANYPQGILAEYSEERVVIDGGGS